MNEILPNGAENMHKLTAAFVQFGEKDIVSLILFKLHLSFGLGAKIGFVSGGRPKFGAVFEKNDRSRISPTDLFVPGALRQLLWYFHWLTFFK